MYVCSWALSDFDGDFLPEFGTEDSPADYCARNSSLSPIALKIGLKVWAYYVRVIWNHTRITRAIVRRGIILGQNFENDFTCDFHRIDTSRVPKKSPSKSESAHNVCNSCACTPMMINEDVLIYFKKYFARSQNLKTSSLIWAKRRHPENLPANVENMNTWSVLTSIRYLHLFSSLLL